MIPWITIPIFTFIAKSMTERFIAKKYSLTKVRKLIESCCFCLQNLALFIMCHTSSFPAALFCMSIIIGKSIPYTFLYSFT